MKEKTGKKELCITIAQLNPTVGAIEDNLRMALEACAQAKAKNADILLFSELFICGYPCEDLTLNHALVEKCMEAIERLAQETKEGNFAIIIGAPVYEDGHLYNAAFMLADGQIIAEQRKFDLPNYNEFDEKRIFTPGSTLKTFSYCGYSFAIFICEDMWNSPEISLKAKNQGAELIFVLNGSPYTREKWEFRRKLIADHAAYSGVPIIYANQVGGQDGLVFDGSSFACNLDGTIALQMKAFDTELGFSYWQQSESGWWCKQGPDEKLPKILEADYRACLLGLRDYVQKNGFEKGIILGLSGGIDSALCATMACDALGSDKVHAVMMPYCYTSVESLQDAQKCAENLQCAYDVLPIQILMEGFSKVLSPLFEGFKEDTTEENLQSRIRGVLLMALSNKFGKMLITTGNKSEMAVGYATIYGDMNGGFNPIKDLYKTEIYALSAWRNKNWLKTFKGPAGQVIPQHIIDKPPSAELREDQTDQDFLPEYDVLDRILFYLVEENRTIEEIIAQGYERETVKKVEDLLYKAEYKRYQSAPGIKLSTESFGRDRRFPITNHFRNAQ